MKKRLTVALFTEHKKSAVKGLLSKLNGYGDAQVIYSASDGAPEERGNCLSRSDIRDCGDFFRFAAKSAEGRYFLPLCNAAGMNEKAFDRLCEALGGEYDAVTFARPAHSLACAVKTERLKLADMAEDFSAELFLSCAPLILAGKTVSLPCSPFQFNQRNPSAACSESALKTLYALDNLFLGKKPKMAAAVYRNAFEALCTANVNYYAAAILCGDGKTKKNLAVYDNFLKGQNPVMHVSVEKRLGVKNLQALKDNGFAKVGLLETGRLKKKFQ